MATYGGNIIVALSNTYGLTNTLCNDLAIYTSNNTQRIVIGTSNTGVLIINSNNAYISGNLGVNNSNPQYPLDILGDLNFTGTLRQSGAAYVGSQWSNNSSNVFIIGSNIGIGKSNPSFALDVTGGINFTTGLYQNGTAYIGSQWSNQSSNVFIIGSNIGIGKSNPAFPLDIIGDLNFTGTLRQGGTPYIGSQWSNNSSNVFIIGSNIGIGKSNPLSTLDITGTLNVTSNVTIGGILTVCNVEYITSNITIFNSEIVNSNLTVLNTITVASNIMPLSNLLYDLGSSNMRFRSIYLASNTIDMAGIQIHADTVNNTLRITNSNNSNAPLVASQLQLGTACNLVTLTLDTNNNIQFNTVSMSNGIAITSNATVAGGWSNYGSNISILGSNVGIFTSNPQAALHVASNLRVDGNMQIYSSLQFTGIELIPGLVQNNYTNLIASTSNIQGYSNLNYGGSNGTLFSIMSNTSNDGFRFVSGTGSNELMRLTGNGYLGIGTSNPGSLLSIAGGHTVGAAYSNLVAPTNGLIVQGNVGIGLSNPQNPLDINGSMRTTSSNGSANQLTLLSYSYSSTNTITFSNTSNGYFLQQIDNASQNYLRMGRYGFGDLIINSNGFIGINTTTPAYALDVNGQIHTNNLFITDNGHLVASAAPLVLNTNSTNAMYFRADTTNGNVGSFCNLATFSTTSHQFYINNNSALFINGNGYLGINTINPSNTLEVNGTTQFDSDFYIKSTSNNWGTQSGRSLYIRYSTNGGQDGTYIQSIDRSSAVLYPMNIFSGNLFIYTGTNGGSIAATFSNNGNVIFNSNVGIGTTTPSFPLHVNGMAWCTSGYGVSGSGGVASNGLYPGPGDGAGYGTYDVQLNSWWGLGIRDTSFNTTNIVFDARAGNMMMAGSLVLSNAYGYQYIKQSNNNIGINTTTPAYTLDVNGITSIIGNNGGGGGGTLILRNTAQSPNPQWVMRGPDWGVNASFNIYYTDNGSTSLQSTYQSGNPAMRIIVSGSSYITYFNGTIVPNNDILMSGNNRIYPQTDNTCTVGSSGNRFSTIYAVNGTIQTSDSNEKNFVPLTYGLNELVKVTPIKYTWKSQASLSNDDPEKNYEYYGVLADELDSIFPELVYNQQRPYQLNYSELIPILINAIKDLNNTNIVLQKQVDKLQTFIQSQFLNFT